MYLPVPGRGVPVLGGVYLPGPGGVYLPGPRGQVHHPPGRYPPPGPGTPPDQVHPPPPRSSRLWNTVNNWPVRILLECILVWCVREGSDGGFVISYVTYNEV